MLVVFPTALFPLLLLLDVLAYAYRDNLAFWTVGFWLAAAGIVTTLVAMVPGIVDLAAIPNEARAHRTAVFHLVTGSLVLVLYVVSLVVRWPAGSDAARLSWATVADVVGVLLIAAQGWLGGELVYKHHIGVLTEAEGADPVTLEGSDAAGRSVARGAARRRGAGRP